MLFKVFPPITAAHVMVFLRSKLVTFITVYAFIPLIFLYGFRLAFPQMPATFFLTGFLANTAFMCAYYPAAFEGFNRVFTSGQYSAMLAAAVPLHRILWEDILWFGIRGLLAALVMTLVAVPLVMPPAEWWLAAAALPIMLMISVGAATAGFLAASLSREFDQLSYSESIVAAIFVFSGVFVQISAFPTFIQYLNWLSPLYHGVAAVRMIMLPATLSWLLAAHLLGMACTTAAAFAITHARLKRRMED